MSEYSKSNNLPDWICRILVTLDIVVILSGYFSWFRAKRQLDSPLIPKSTVYQIFSDGGDTAFKASIFAAVFFLTGLWFYSFQKKKIAIIAFLFAVVSYKLIFLLA